MAWSGRIIRIICSPCRRITLWLFTMLFFFHLNGSSTLAASFNRILNAMAIQYGNLHDVVPVLQCTSGNESQSSARLSKAKSAWRATHAVFLKWVAPQENKFLHKRTAAVRSGYVHRSVSVLQTTPISTLVWGILRVAKLEGEVNYVVSSV